MINEKLNPPPGTRRVIKVPFLKITIHLLK